MYQNYIIGQTSLTLNLDFSIPNNHLASVISDFVDSIPNEVLLGDTSSIGRPAYHPALMLKILLFAYSRRVFSGRKIERMLEENLPMMVIAQGQHISYNTINNFRSSEHANHLIKRASSILLISCKKKAPYLSMELRLKPMPTSILLFGRKLSKSIMLN